MGLGQAILERVIRERYKGISQMGDGERRKEKVAPYPGGHSG
jgi:hypothetical protein